ncbi:hypothetical protein SEA_PARTRIDGE_64 [Rhodococcus phage Partridge]|uniref:Uncharacterized protein n=1 Tax=Rhodococcus phage Partridge TaxID=1897441 RepID=A0A1I9S7X9_9CAUD|nr:hypothetical protein SEA_PARTRIDGE_64 [Rhodococcus phage Partridge]
MSWSIRLQGRQDMSMTLAAKPRVIRGDLEPENPWSVVVRFRNDIGVGGFEEVHSSWEEAMAAVPAIYEEMRA